MLGHVESMSRTTLMLLFILALVVPVALTSVRIYQKQLAPEELNCDVLATTLEAIDTHSTVPRNPILIIGDTTLKHWDHPLLTVGKNEVIIRSPKGINTSIVGECFQRVVAFYHPRVTVLFIEREELSKPSSIILEALDTIDERRNYYGVSPHLVLIPPMHVPIDGKREERSNNLRHELERWSSQHPGTRVTNISPALEDPTRRTADPKLFWPDGRTLTTEGYRRMNVFLKGALEPMAAP